MKTGSPPRCAGRLGAGVCQVPITQGNNFAVQRHQVRRWLGIHDHQVAGDAAPRPQPQALNQRTQQSQALRDAGRHQNNRMVA